jgi:hypothetical protein
MSETQVFSVRLPAEVAEVLADKAAPRSVGEYLAELARKAAGAAPKGADRAFGAVKAAAVEWVHERYTPRRFPRDVIRLAFAHIAQTPKLRKLHDEGIRDEDGQPDRQRKARLHRQIGQAIRRALSARVDGRSPPLDPEEALIESFTYLVPGKDGEE